MMVFKAGALLLFGMITLCLSMKKNCYWALGLSALGMGWPIFYLVSAVGDQSDSGALIPNAINHAAIICLTVPLLVGTITAMEMQLSFFSGAFSALTAVAAVSISGVFRTNKQEQVNEDKN